jgi:hypothetical protein
MEDLFYYFRGGGRERRAGTARPYFGIRMPPQRAALLYF